MKELECNTNQDQNAKQRNFVDFDLRKLKVNNKGRYIYDKG